MRIENSLRMFLLLGLAAASSSAGAGDADDQKVLRVQRQLRQVMQERDALQGENSQLKGQIEDLNKKLAGLKKSSDNALAKSRENNTALSADLQNVTRNLRQTESAKNQLQETVVGQAQQIESCEANNVKMVQINRELVDRYEKKGVFDAWLQREPLTQLKRVEVENIVQEYQDLIDQSIFKRKQLNAQ